MKRQPLAAPRSAQLLQCSCCRASWLAWWTPCMYSCHDCSCCTALGLLYRLLLLRSRICFADALHVTGTSIKSTHACVTGIQGDSICEYLRFLQCHTLSQCKSTHTEVAICPHAHLETASQTDCREQGAVRLYCTTSLHSACRCCHVETGGAPCALATANPSLPQRLYARVIQHCRLFVFSLKKTRSGPHFCSTPR